MSTQYTPEDGIPSIRDGSNACPSHASDALSRQAQKEPVMAVHAISKLNEKISIYKKATGAEDS